MDSSRTKSVLVVGGGPVGLYCALLLRRRGISVTVLEKRATCDAGGSRAIGVMPSTLARMAKVDLAEVMIGRGLAIHRALVFENGRREGSLRFDGLPGPFPFILSLPQDETTGLLADACARAGVPVERGVTVTSVHGSDHDVSVEALRDGKSIRFKADHLIGADGHRSVTRECAGISWVGRESPHRFLMADFDESGPWGSDAALFFGPRGAVESFPLPAGRRRWILDSGRSKEPPEPPSDREFKLEVEARIGASLPGERISPFWSFRPRRFVAGMWRRGRIRLAGDAAHVMSPIGGQGLNVGFDIAERIVDSIVAEEPGDPRERNIGRFTKAARRAEGYLRIGAARGELASRVRGWLVRTVLRRPPRLLAERFAMLR